MGSYCRGSTVNCRGDLFNIIYFYSVYYITYFLKDVRNVNFSMTKTEVTFRYVLDISLD